MNSKEFKTIQKNLISQNKRWPKTPSRLPEKDWPKYQQTSNLTGVWRSRDFLIQVFEEPNGFIRISVNRTMIRRDGHWKDDISWDDLQWIKSKIGFDGKFAVEIFPPDIDIINVANMRHLWVLPEPPDYGWRAQCQE